MPELRNDSKNGSNIECKLEIRGRIGRIVASNGRVIAEFLFHGPLAQCAYHASNGNDIIPGRPNIFRGELYGLASWEILDIENERIIEK